MLLPLWLAENLMYLAMAIGLVPMLVLPLFPKRRWWVTLLAVLAALAFVELGFQLDSMGAAAIIVKFPASGFPVETTRGRLYSSKSYTLQNGTTVRIAPSDDHYATTIVNDTPRTLRIESVQYATSSVYALPKLPPETIAPYSVKNDGPIIDEVGPDEHPPATTDSVINETFRYHLTWGGRESEPTRTKPAPTEPRSTPDASVEAARDASTDACVDESGDARQRYIRYADEVTGPVFPADASDNPWFQRSKAPDLDGDGVPEFVWAFGMPVASRLDLYRGGACTMHLGSFKEGGSITRRPAKHDGWHDFATQDFGLCEGAACGCTPDEREYTFAKGQYVEVTARRKNGSVTQCPGSVPR